jgi:hypothetical protein
VSFNTSNPATFLSSVQISGADLGTPASGNPNGQQFIISGIASLGFASNLYGMRWRNGFEQRVYTINPTTGVATALPNGPSISAGSASFSIDPIRNVIRVATDQGGNYHIDPATGNTTTDTNLAYAAGDPNSGVTPIVASAAYTPYFSLGGTLYGIDARGTGTLVGMGTGIAADSGQLDTLAALMLPFSIPPQSHVGFYDFDGLNAYAAIEPSANAASQLFFIDPQNGFSFDMGQIGPNGTPPIWGLTVPVPEPGNFAFVGTALVGALGYGRRRQMCRVGPATWNL